MDALKKVDSGRRCFRMVGGVLVERTVKDVLPALQYNSDQVGVRERVEGLGVVWGADPLPKTGERVRYHTIDQFCTSSKILAPPMRLPSSLSRVGVAILNFY
jgi:hypothetical protein